MIALSLGWGIQSHTMAAMSALGELPRVDVAIHADTTHEREATYEFAAKWTGWLEKHGIRVVTVLPKHNDPINNGFGWPDSPFYTIAPNGGNGQIKRQCTSQWKIYPMRRWLQANRNRQSVEQWIGISTDEALRMKESDVKYITNRWPLIEKHMSRNDCVAWLKAHDLEVPPRSSCVFCPYHNSAEWREMWKEQGADWRKSVEVDNQIRKARPPYDLFVHPARKPLTEIDLRNDEDRGQLRLWDEECTGMCGL
jgi:3'-phosphoadenosine 5'-phosphosulfate sulfotransferase (PAPS reductase)/FAD synthetase